MSARLISPPPLSPVTTMPPTAAVFPVFYFYWAFDGPGNSMLEFHGVPTSGIMAVPGSFFRGVQGRALFFDVNQWVDLGDFSDSCFGNPTLCVYGTTHAFWFWLDASILRVTSRLYLISNGAQAGYYGWALYWESGYLWVIHASQTARWGPVRITVQDEQWYHMTVVWHPAQGLLIYLNGYLNTQVSGGVGTTSRWGLFLITCWSLTLAWISIHIPCNLLSYPRVPPPPPPPPPCNEVEGGGLYWIHLVRPSIRPPSVFGW